MREGLPDLQEYVNNLFGMFLVIGPDYYNALVTSTADIFVS